MNYIHVFVHLYVYNLQAPTSLSQFTQLTPNKLEALDILRVIGTWVDLESIILSEDKYHVISLICGIFKKWYNQNYKQNRNRCTDIENMITEGERVRREKLGVWD